MHHDFKFIVNLTKGYKDSDGRLFVEGIASSTNLDLTDERMSPDAIKAMAESLQQGLVEFRSEHRDDWDSTFGEVVEMSVSDGYQLCAGRLVHPRSLLSTLTARLPEITPDRVNGQHTPGARRSVCHGASYRGR